LPSCDTVPDNAVGAQDHEAEKPKKKPENRNEIPEKGQQRRRFHLVWRKRRSPRLGVALGGGGARGGIHIGVLRVLEERRIPIYCLVGTSIGAVIGALYAITPDANEVEKRILEYLESDTFHKTRFDLLAQVSSGSRLSLLERVSAFLKKEFILTLALSRPCLIPREQVRENLAFLFNDIHIEETRIPFAAVATDLETGEGVVIREGSLIDALYASCTYPGVVEAARLNGRLLVDGGAIEIVPVKATRAMGAEVVVAVDTEPHLETRLDDLSALEIIWRVDNIIIAELARCKTADADIVIRPGTGETEWYDFQKAPGFISLGEEATREKVPTILAALEPRPLLRILRTIRSALATTM
jgi:NTE family protein